MLAKVSNTMRFIEYNPIYLVEVSIGWSKIFCNDSII